jgi:phage-related protein
MMTVGTGVRKFGFTSPARTGCSMSTRPEAIYVLHAFEKETQKTAARDLKIGRDRFRGLAMLRQHHGKEKRR